MPGKKGKSRKVIKVGLYVLAVPLILFGAMMTWHGIFSTTYDLEPDYARGLDIFIGLFIAGCGALLGLVGFLLKKK